MTNPDGPNLMVGLTIILLISFLSFQLGTLHGG